MATLTKPSREYRDVDFSFNSHPETKNLLVKTKLNAVKQSVVNLLTLRKGDKPFHPEIKSPIFDYLFDNITAVERLILEGEVSRYLTNYEPRLRVDSVKIFFTDPNSINCYITGTVLNILEPFTVNILINRLR